MLNIFKKKNNETKAKPTNVMVVDEQMNEKLLKILQAAQEDHHRGDYAKSNEKLDTIVDFYAKLIDQRGSEISNEERALIAATLISIQRIIEVNDYKLAEREAPKFTPDNIDTVEIDDMSFEFLMRYGQDLSHKGEYDLAVKVSRRADAYLLGKLNTSKEPNQKMHLAKAIAHIRATIAENETLKLFRKELEEPARLAAAAKKEKAA